MTKTGTVHFKNLFLEQLVACDIRHAGKNFGAEVTFLTMYTFLR